MMIMMIMMIIYNDNADNLMSTQELLRLGAVVKAL